MQFVQIHGKSNSDNEYQVASFNDIATVFPFSPIAPFPQFYISDNAWPFKSIMNEYLHCGEDRVECYTALTSYAQWVGKSFFPFPPLCKLSKALFGTNWMHKIQLPNTNNGFLFLPPWWH